MIMSWIGLVVLSATMMMDVGTYFYHKKINKIVQEQVIEEKIVDDVDTNTENE